MYTYKNSCMALLVSATLAITPGVYADAQVTTPDVATISEVIVPDTVNSSSEAPVKINLSATELAVPLITGATSGLAYLWCSASCLVALYNQTFISAILAAMSISVAIKASERKHTVLSKFFKNDDGKPSTLEAMKSLDLMVATATIVATVAAFVAASQSKVATLVIL